MILIQLINHTPKLIIVFSYRFVTLAKTKYLLIHLKDPRGITLQRICITSNVLNIGWYTVISAEIPVFYPKRYDKCKNLSDIILDRYGPIYRHVTDIDISADIQHEISNILTDTVTYLDNYYFFAWDHFFCSMFIVVFQWCFYIIFG